MIDGTDNEIAGAFAQLLEDRSDIEELLAKPVEIARQAEDTAWFWNHVNSMVDRMIYHYDEGAAR